MQAMVIVCRLIDRLMSSVSRTEFHRDALQQGRVLLNLQTITIACIELSDASRSLAAGGTAYFAIAYTTPVLDAHQQVKDHDRADQCRRRAGVNRTRKPKALRESKP